MRIAAIDGVDCLWVGHFDLSVSLGIPGEFDHPNFTARHRPDRSPPAKKHNKSLGRLVPNVETGHRPLRAGLRFHLLFGRRLGAARRACRSAVAQASAPACKRKSAERLTPWPNHRFRVALSGDFRKAGRLADLSRFRPRAAARRARRRDGLPRIRQVRCAAEQLEDFDALILLAHRFDAEQRAEERPPRRRRALRRRLRHGRRRGLHRGRHRAGHHAGRRAPAGRGLDHHPHAGADRQADDQGPR